MKVRVRLLDPRRMSVTEEVMEVESVGAMPPHLDDGRKVLSMEVIKAASANAGIGPKPRSLRAQSLDVAWWCQELRTLLDAGMTVVEAIETLHAQSMRGGDRERLQAALLMELQQGKALSVAMESLQRFPMVLVASVRASERSSSLADALTEYLRYHDLVETLRKKVISAAIYPSLVLGLGLTVSTFLILVVLPRFASMYADLHGSMSWTTSLLTTASAFVREHRLAMLLALALSALGVVAAWRHGLVQAVAMRTFGRIGFVRRALREFQLAKLFHSLTVMFRGGYPIDEALERCEGLALGPALELGMRNARVALHRGVRISTALTDAGMTDAVTQRLLAVGERSGRFERVLQTIADRHASNFAAFMDRTTRVVEPAMLLAVSLLVGSIVVLMYLPIFDIASSIR